MGRKRDSMMGKLWDLNGISHGFLWDLMGIIGIGGIYWNLLGFRGAPWQNCLKTPRDFHGKIVWKLRSLEGHQLSKFQPFC